MISINSIRIFNTITTLIALIEIILANMQFAQNCKTQVYLTPI